MLFLIHCMGRWEHVFMHVACVCEYTSANVGSIVTFGNVLGYHFLKLLSSALAFLWIQ
jgi:hypothetical protein